MESMPGSAMAAPLIADSEGIEADKAAVPPTAKYGFGASPQREGKPADVVVNVTGLQFAWIFNYPESGITSGELHVPIGKDVQLNLSAQDVIHSFWVPQFRLKQDAIPGQDTELRFVATKPGTYPVVCAELCGAYHGAMRTQLMVDSQEDYEAWVNENRVAQAQNPKQTVAANPADLSASEFLAPYAEEMGIDARALAQLRSAH
jgi:cytochrome c oxidase subunit 2